MGRLGVEGEGVDVEEAVVIEDLVNGNRKIGESR